MAELSFEIIYWLSFLLFIFVFTGVAVRLIMLLLSIVWIFYEKSILSTSTPDLPGISLLIPAYNEEDEIVNSVTHAINQDYPELEIIVVNDGSGDSTIEKLIHEFNLQLSIETTISDSIPTQEIHHIYKSDDIPNLTVVDKTNGGKADALNCGINTASTDYVLCVDADTLLTKNTIKYLIKPFLLDKRVVVTSGSVRIISNSKRFSLLTNLQQIEFVNSISLFRSGWNFLNANLIISGALGLFNRKMMIQVGGYHNLAIGEDMELIIRIHRYLCDKKEPYRIIQLAFPVCFTRAIPTIHEMGKQRKRWQKGLLSSIRLNLTLFLNCKYGWTGVAGIPFYILFEIFAPFAEIFGFILFFFVMLYPNMTMTPLVIWVGGLLLAIVNNWISISLDKFLLRGMSWSVYFKLLLSSLSDPFFYHFFQIYFKIKGTVEYFSEIQISTVWDTRRNKQ